VRGDEDVRVAQVERGAKLCVEDEVSQFVLYKRSRLVPAAVWATIGGLFLVFEVYLLGAWLLSGPERTPIGPDPLPGWMEIAVRAFEIGGLIAFAAVFYLVIIRPFRRLGRLSADGILALALITLWWQDPLSDYFVPWFTYNTAFTNWGSWLGHVPGVLLPNAERFADSPVWTLPMYLYLVFGSTILGCAFMRWARRRWPGLSTVGLIGVTALFFFTFDLTLESICMRLGFWAYPGAISWLTMFHGHYYQLPLTEVLIITPWWTSFTCIRYFKNDKGETLAERGLERLRVQGKRRTGVRFLALVGIYNIAFLAFYNIPAAVQGLWASPWPQDILERRYLTNGLCGPGTDYACPGPGLPINRPDSVHVSPDGRLVVPEGTKLPSPAD
jgi:hypothetical protein